MKLTAVLLVVILVPSLLLAACTPAVPTAVNISCSDFNNQPHVSKHMTVVVGDTFTVTLCSNPTTGFQWSESAQIVDPTIVQQTIHEFVSPENTGVVGAPGSEVWTFQALKKGITILSLEYGRPWPGGEKGVWTFSLTVAAN